MPSSWGSSPVRGQKSLSSMSLKYGSVLSETLSAKNVQMSYTAPDSKARNKHPAAATSRLTCLPPIPLTVPQVLAPSDAGVTQLTS